MGPKPMGIQAFFGFVIESSLFGVLPPLICHFEDGHFTLSQTIESLRNGEALNSTSSLKWA